MRAIGASNFDAPRLAEALDVSAARAARYETLQPHYNLYERGEFEGALAAAVRARRARRHPLLRRWPAAS